MSDSPPARKLQRAYSDSVTPSAESVWRAAEAGEWDNVWHALEDVPSLANGLASGREYGLIHLCAYRGNVDALRRMYTTVRLNLDLQSREQRRTALHVAALSGHANAFQALLELGANASIIDASGKLATYSISLAFQPSGRSPPVPLMEFSAPVFDRPRILNDPLLNRAVGAFLGVAVGDAIGSVLERGSRPDSTAISNALRMSGGGALHLGPGQLSDEGELCLALADVLASSEKMATANSVLWRGADMPSGVLGSVATSYLRWYRSDPVDVSAQCERALRSAGSSSTAGDFSEAMVSAAQASMNDRHVGALARCVPLALWGRQLHPIVLAAAVTAEVSLTHADPVCHEAAVCYALAVAALADGRTRTTAYDIVFTWAHCHSKTKVRKWVEEVGNRTRESSPTTDAGTDRDSGQLKHAFTMAFRCLMNGSSFEEALREALRTKGETGAVAAAVCGLIGATEGLASIPMHISNSLLSTGSNGRPAWLHPNRIPTLAGALANAAIRDPRSIPTFEPLPAVDRVRISVYRGPTPDSNWVVPSCLLAGAYPGNRTTGSERRSLLDRLLRTGITTFVCLQTPAELQRFEAYAPAMRDLFSTDDYPQTGHPLAFVNFPIQDLDVGPDEKVAGWAEEVIERMRSGEMIYVHCWGGLGRTSAFCSLVLGKLHDVSARDALERIDIYHSCRERSAGASSSLSKAQKEQIKRLLPRPSTPRHRGRSGSRSGGGESSAGAQSEGGQRLRHKEQQAPLGRRHSSHALSGAAGRGSSSEDLDPPFRPRSNTGGSTVTTASSGLTVTSKDPGKEARSARMKELRKKIPDSWKEQKPPPVSPQTPKRRSAASSVVSVTTASTRKSRTSRTSTTSAARSADAATPRSPLVNGSSRDTQSRTARDDAGSGSGSACMFGSCSYSSSMEPLPVSPRSRPASAGAMRKEIARDLDANVGRGVERESGVYKVTERLKTTSIASPKSPRSVLEKGSPARPPPSPAASTRMRSASDSDSRDAWRKR